MFSSRFARGACALVPLVLPLAAGAALIDRGNGMICDDDRHITWLANADLLGTQLTAANPAQRALLITAIIAASPTVFDGRNTHVVTAFDFATAGSSHQGLASWYGATAWANYLDAVNYDGFSNWRLPTSLQPDTACSIQSHIAVGDYFVSSGAGCIGSEVGHLFYNELGGQADSALATTHNDQAGDFSHVQSDYWTGRTFVQDNFGMRLGLRRNRSQAKPALAAKQRAAVLVFVDRPRRRPRRDDATVGFRTRTRRRAAAAGRRGRTGSLASTRRWDRFAAAHAIDRGGRRLAAGLPADRRPTGPRCPARDEISRRVAVPDRLRRIPW